MSPAFSSLYETANRFSGVSTFSSQTTSAVIIIMTYFVQASFFPQSRQTNAWTGKEVHIPSLPDEAKEHLVHVTWTPRKILKPLEFFWELDFGFLLNICPFIINILSLDDPFWWHIEMWETQALEQPTWTRIYLDLRSGGKWLSLESNLSQDPLGEHAVTGLPEHWGITMDASPTLNLVKKNTCLPSKAKLFQNTKAG